MFPSKSVLQLSCVGMQFVGERRLRARASTAMKKLNLLETSVMDFIIFWRACHIEQPTQKLWVSYYIYKAAVLIHTQNYYNVWPLA